MSKEKSLVIVSSIVAAILIFFGVRIILPRDGACEKMDAKLGLAEDFCQGLAERASEERCSSLADDPETMGQCLRVIVPAAHSSCMDYLNVQRLKNQKEALCD